MKRAKRVSRAQAAMYAARSAAWQRERHWQEALAEASRRVDVGEVVFAPARRPAALADEFDDDPNAPG